MQEPTMLGRQLTIGIREVPLSEPNVLETAILDDPILSDALKMFMETDMAKVEVFQYKGNIAATEQGYFIAFYDDSEARLRRLITQHEEHMSYRQYVQYQIFRECIFLFILVVVANTMFNFAESWRENHVASIMLFTLGMLLLTFVVVFVLNREQIRKKWKI